MNKTKKEKINNKINQLEKSTNDFINNRRRFNKEDKIFFVNIFSEIIKYLRKRGEQF